MRFPLSITLICGGLIATAAVAQDPVASLQTLVGARGTAVDGLAQRGYTLHHAAKSDDSSYTYWLDDAGRCVAARVTDGRVASIVYSEGDCVEADAAAPDPDFFRTVCGVIRNGETYRYRCQARETTEDGRRVTVLRFPDNEMTFVWMADGKATIEREGLVPTPATYSTSEGETDIITDEMTYFYISDRGMAEFEIENFRD